uniref:RRM domain-containing protein n=1 Tax=Neogobius melanostomus TaxID=47308 RepID=A0A8C6V1K6_9GOBI
LATESDQGKLFVGGLSCTTTKETLAAAFGQYGALKEVRVIGDPHRGVACHKARQETAWGPQL